jgi:rod shape-determining protein MreC
MDFALAGFLVLLPAAFLSANFKNPGHLNAFDKVVLRVSSPIQAGVTWVIDGLGTAWHRYLWHVDTEKENEELRKANENLRLENAELKRQVADAQTAYDLNVLRTRHEGDMIGARVVAVGTNPAFRVLRIEIDRGSGEVRLNMPVITDKGVVGRIGRVTGHFADVLLAVDPDSSIPVMDVRTGGRGSLKGLGADNSYNCMVQDLAISDEVKEGDLIVTSGLGGLFPPDLPVGTVTKVSTPQSGLTQVAEVKPDVDFSRLHSVLVVLAPPPPPDPNAKDNKDRRPEPAYGVTPYK